MRILPDKTPGGIDNGHLSAEGWHPQVGAPVLVLLLNGHAHPPCSDKKDDAAAHQGCFDFDTRSVVDVRPDFEPPYRRKVDARDPGQIVDRPVKRGARHATLYVSHFEAATIRQVITRCGFAAIYAKRLTVLVLEGASADATGVFCPTLSKRGRLNWRASRIVSPSYGAIVIPARRVPPEMSMVRSVAHDRLEKPGCRGVTRTLTPRRTRRLFP